MKGKIILLILALILIIGATNRFYLYQYEEECLEYRVDSWIELYCYDWANMWEVKMFNETHKYNSSYWTCDQLTFWYSYNKTIHNTTDVCLKYHLVRYS